MTDSRWLDEWLRTWQSLPGAAQANPWTAALDQLAQSGNTGLPQPLAEVFDKLAAQSRVFFQLGHQLADHDTDDWQQSVLDYLDEVATCLRDPDSTAAQTGMPPLDYWRRLAGHGDGEAGDHQSFMAQLERMLQTPGLGCTREQQEAAQELSRRWLVYQQAHGEYLAYCAETIRIAVQRLRGRFTAQFKAGEGPGSLRELYVAWLACCEEVHGERAAGEEYTRRHGRMINALMAYRQQTSQLVDQLAEAVNLPTRTEVDVLHRKVKDLQQEVRELKARPAGEPASD